MDDDEVVINKEFVDRVLAHRLLSGPPMSETDFVAACYLIQTNGGNSEPNPDDEWQKLINSMFPKGWPTSEG